ncbi:ATP-binding cassette domain-containing protein, partial [Pseudomonas aeruginosa]|nr:ATP-binding cassette domain-containing protein [Pseudomonas aeruginosa]
GPSGCGKTTLLNALCGFIPVQSGEVAIASRTITHLAPEQRNITMVFQSYALWPHLTVARNIGYGLKLRKWRGADIARRVAEACRMIETAETPLALEALAARLGMSPFHFHRLFKAETGL